MENGPSQSIRNDIKHMGSSPSQRLQDVLKQFPPELTSTYDQAISGNKDLINDFIGYVKEATASQYDAGAAGKLELNRTNTFLFFQAARIVLGKDRTSFYDYRLERDVKQAQNRKFLAGYCSAAPLIQPTDTLTVALSVKLIEMFHVKFVIRITGYLPDIGFEEITNTTVILDVGELSDIKLSQNRDICSVGPGARWRQIYEALEEHKLTAVGARDGNIGAGDLLTGGDLSFFPNSYGLGCDNVKEFEVVLGGGTVVKANKDREKSLFKALKGGGLNFGIVTRFDLYTNSDHGIWYQKLYLYDVEDDDISKAFAYLATAMEKNDRLGGRLIVTAKTAEAMVWYRGYHSDAMNAFQGVLNILKRKSYRAPEDTTVSEMVSSFSESISTRKYKRTTIVATFRSDESTSKMLLKRIKDVVSSEWQVGVSILVQPLVASAVEQSDKHGGNVLAIPSETQLVVSVCAKWNYETGTETIMTNISKAVEKVSELARELGPPSAMLMNEAWSSPNAPKGSGESNANVDFMNEVSRRYDPEQVFQDLQIQSAGFLLSNLGKKESA